MKWNVELQDPNPDNRFVVQVEAATDLEAIEVAMHEAHRFGVIIWSVDYAKVQQVGFTRFTEYDRANWKQPWRLIE